MEELGNWRHYSWVAGAAVSASMGGLIGARERMQESFPTVTFAVAGLLALGLASVAILPAHGSNRTKVRSAAVTLALYALAGHAVYWIACLGDLQFGTG